MPSALFDDLTAMVQKFWWGQSNKRNKMIWLSWDKMCLSKEESGLGFQDLKSFNTALLVKQGWRLQNCTNTVVHRVFKACYFPNGDFYRQNWGTIHHMIGEIYCHLNLHCNARVVGRWVMELQFG